MSSRPDYIFEIRQLWQSDFSRVYSNCCYCCSFEAEIIKIGQSSDKMYSNDILNFQESTTILNACTKKSGNLLKAPHILNIWLMFLNKPKLIFSHNWNNSCISNTNTELNLKTVLFQTIQNRISTRFSSIWPIRCFHSMPECTWERWQRRGNPHSPRLQHYWSLTISRPLFGGILPVCRDAVSVFYSPSGLGQSSYRVKK